MELLYTTKTRWAVKWISDNRLSGHIEHFLHTPEGWKVFRTRAEARAYRNEHYGYIKNRPDLRAEPHGWKMPRVVKVVLSIQESE